MLGKTHISAALASAAVLTFNYRISIINPIILSGAIIGGLMPDIDLENSTISKYINNKFIAISIGLLSFLMFITFHLKLGNPLLRIFYKYQYKLIGIFILLISIAFSKFTGHRMYSHSISGLSVFSFGIYLIYKPALIWFAVGYISHILIDLLNFQGEALLFPFKGTYSFKICKSNGVINKCMFFIGLAVFIIFAIKNIRII